MDFFRRLSNSSKARRRQSDTGTCSSQNSELEFTAYGDKHWMGSIVQSHQQNPFQEKEDKKLVLSTNRRTVRKRYSVSESLKLGNVKQSDANCSKTRSRSLSLGAMFSKGRSRHLSEQYATDFWTRNFADKTIVPWCEFRGAFVLDYKNRLEEFSKTGHLSCVLDAARDKLCNKDSVVYINRYKKFVGSDTKPDALWNRIKEEATRRLFEEALEDSLCL